ncbi:MAG: hypothetical protein U9O85_03220 [Euryarchaeota archaeon]|nr:hypothetical protein [Euryarchaeota archaeon]
MDKLRQETNKMRWEKWRAEQKTEREKTYFHCWGDWSDVTACECAGCTQINPVKQTDDYDYKEYRYTIRPQYMKVKDGETWNIYLTAHLYTRYEEPREWIEIGARMVNGWSKPKVFAYVCKYGGATWMEEFEDWSLKTIKEFKLIVNPAAGQYFIYERISGDWTCRKSGWLDLQKLCLADMDEEYFSDTCWYTESNKDRIEAAKLVTGTGINKDFDDVPYDCWSSVEWWSSLKYNDIPDGLECWIECD